MAKRTANEENIVQSLRVIFQAIQRHSSWVEKHCGVSASQLWAMTELYNESGLRVSDIANRLSIKNSTASNMLDKIQKKGLIERKREQKDQRVVTLYLTEIGKQLLRNAAVPTQGVVIGALKLLSDKEVSAISHSLELLISKISHHENLPASEPLDG